MKKQSSHQVLDFPSAGFKPATKIHFNGLYRKRFQQLLDFTADPSSFPPHTRIKLWLAPLPDPVIQLAHTDDFS